jgi:hypothetical protein
MNQQSRILETSGVETSVGDGKSHKHEAHPGAACETGISGEHAHKGLGLF